MPPPPSRMCRRRGRPQKRIFSDNSRFFILLDFLPLFFMVVSVHIRIQIRFRDFDLCAWKSRFFFTRVVKVTFRIVNFIAFRGLENIRIFKCRNDENFAFIRSINDSRIKYDFAPMFV